ncbi:MAG: hypothetical protein A2Z72_06485 [Omnitrophica bacterium RBG_13_46_9]|nr:MAG: hypothetical protein A2Z72_06485 [Omnitrophica bacterium RBG_13_46_9]
MTKLRFSHSLIIILSCGILALGYVHQEIEILKTGFLISKRHCELSFLLDQHRSLVYNLSQLETPKRIEDTLCVNEIVLCMPRTENMRRIENTVMAESEEKVKAGYKESFLAKMFDRVSAKAEAKVVK